MCGRGQRLEWLRVYDGVENLGLWADDQRHASVSDSERIGLHDWAECGLAAGDHLAVFSLLGVMVASADVSGASRTCAGKWIHNVSGWR